MKEHELFENQYGKKKLVYTPQKQFLGLRGMLQKYDHDRIKACTRLVPKGHRCLDIGCNDGRLLRGLSADYDELYGLDISPSTLREAYEKTQNQFPTESQRFRWVAGNAGEGVPFDDAFFDTVISVATLQLIYDVFNVIKEMKRVVKRGGFVIIQVPNLAYLFRRLSLLTGRLPVTSAAEKWEESGWDGGSINYFTMDKLRWLLETNDFTIVTRSGSGFLANLRNWWPSLLSADLIIKAEKL